MIVSAHLDLQVSCYVIVFSLLSRNMEKDTKHWFLILIFFDRCEVKTKFSGYKDHILVKM